MRGDLEREPERRPDVRAVPGDGEPFERQAGRRELEARLLGGEGVEEDQQDRQVQEQQPRRGRDAGGRAARRRVRAHRRLPAVWRAQVDHMMTMGTTAKAAASGMLPAVPCCGIDRQADEVARSADDRGDDVVAEGQREGEDRAGDDAGQGQRQDHVAEGLAGRPRRGRPRLRAAIAAPAPAPPASAGSCNGSQT